uniref:Sulfatase N-terminal domain-containing protein n=1 Tax=Megaselia scalaris TaxID=36166 RepID=T1GHE4_MEGSC
MWRFPCKPQFLGLSNKIFRPANIFFSLLSELARHWTPVVYFMADNTYPNLMAILTGFNSTRGFTECAPRVKGKLDNCPFIWKQFQDQGYKPPVDYYLRPFLLQAEKSLPVKKKSGMTFCLGFKHAAEYVYDYAVELTERYKGYPYFGFFWTNTFSHQSISDPSSMDVKILEYLQNFSNSGVLNDTIVFFFSDHGMRFGPTRSSTLGHYEERLPFMFIWLPTWIKETYPEFVTALTVNKNQLTNPYDIHMTLQHILQLANDNDNALKPLPQTDGCPRCQTLLKPVPFNRSCEDISIEDHWCTCLAYDPLKVTDKISTKLGKAVINYINDFVGTFSFASHCKKLSLGNIKYLLKARKGSAATSRNSTSETYRITFYTLPNKGLFEATVRHTPNEKPDMTITGEISRLNVYASDSQADFSADNES